MEWAHKLHSLSTLLGNGHGLTCFPGNLAVADLQPWRMYLRSQNEMWFLHPWEVTARPPAHFVWKIALSINSCDCQIWYAGRVQKAHLGNLDVGVYVGRPCMVKSSCLFRGPDAKWESLPQIPVKHVQQESQYFLQFALVYTISILPGMHVYVKSFTQRRHDDMYCFLQNQWQEPGRSFHDPKISSDAIPWQGGT